MGSPISVADISSGITSVEIDCGAGSESCGGGKRLLAWEKIMLEIFGWGPCWFGIFGSVSTRQLRESTLLIRVLGRTCLVTTYGAGKTA